MNRLIAIIFFWVVTCTIGYGRLADIAPIVSPDGAYAASIRLLPAKDLGQEASDSTLPNAKLAVLVLRDALTNKNLHQIRVPDADDTDNRNSINLSWSPDGRVLVVQVQIGQLSQFSLYHVEARHLVPLDELPTPERLVIHSEHQKSRGGTYIQRWITPDTFVSVDTVSDAAYTYRITKQWKLETIASKAIQP